MQKLASNNQVETIEGDDVVETLQIALQDNTDGILTYKTMGKWQIKTVRIIKISEYSITSQVITDEDMSEELLRVDQPVGMSIRINETKFIFETTVKGIQDQTENENGVGILLDKPDRIEKIQRRGYQRQEVPEDLNVMVLFWHRGYLHATKQAPRENYWRGKMINISAGGMRMSVNAHLKDCFCRNQIVGLQFTPMYYQKPIMVEGIIQYTEEDASDNSVQLGIEFVGLEASVEGRQILHRLLEVVQDYNAIIKQSKK